CLHFRFTCSHYSPMDSRGGADLLRGCIEVDNCENGVNERAEAPPPMTSGAWTGHDFHTNIVILGSIACRCRLRLDRHRGSCCLRERFVACKFPTSIVFLACSRSHAVWICLQNTLLTQRDFFLDIERQCRRIPPYNFRSVANWRMQTRPD